MIEILKQVGIDAGLLISGLFGAILLMSKTSSNNLKTTFLSLIGGAASANYLTPLVLDMLNVKAPNANFAVAFLLGFLGLKGVELASEKMFGKSTVIKRKK